MKCIMDCKASLVFLSLIFGLELSAQTDFINPLTIPLRLSATFGELRSDHFHAGIDLKTQQQEGFPVVAIADGYVSRIVISPTGYGKALYIAHPNGYTSVYGHLQRMNGPIADFILKRHYELRSHTLDESLEPGLLKVKKGDTIAFSGNTGSSGGPHLHFEIRDTRSGQTLNPLDFGFKIKDWVRPKIEFIKIYPAELGAHVKGSPEPVYQYLSGWGPNYRLKDVDTLKIAGKVWFGISAYDLAVDEPNKNGVRSILLLIDSIEVFSIEWNRFSFDKTRYINALCDYKERYLTQQWVVQTRLAPCNMLDIYVKVLNQGIYEFEENKIYHVQFVVKDHYQNESVLRFVVQGVSKIYAPIRPFNTSSRVLKCNEPSRFDTINFSFSAPAEAFYDTVRFIYKQMPAPPAYYSDFHKVHTPVTPVHKAVDISIRPNRLPQRLKNKAVIVKINERGNPFSVGGKWNGDMLKASVRSFGTFAILADTLPPRVGALGWKNNQLFRESQHISFSISDDLSGIKSYTALINGNWALLEYDPKNNLLSYMPDSLLKPGNNTVALSVTDGVGNSTSVEYSIQYQP